MARPNQAKQSKSTAKAAGGTVARLLTPKQTAFCREYLVDLNATQAAARAGYSAATANEQGARLLANVSVSEEIARLMAAREERTDITGDRVIEELATMAFYDPAEIGGADIRGPADIAKLPEKVRRCIVGWGWDKAGNFTLKLAAKTPQLELIGRHLGLFRDKIEHSGPGGGPIETSPTLSPEQIAQIERIRGRREALQQPAK